MSAIGIIIGREFRERVMKKSFIISTILTPLLMVGIMVGTSFIMATNVGEAKHIAVVDRSGVIAPSLTSTEVIVYEPTDRTPEELRAEGDEQMYGFLVIGEDIVENPSNVSLYSYSTSTMEVESAIARDIEEVIEQHRLKAYDIENLPQIMDEVEADVTLRSYKLGEEDEEDKESSSVLAFGLSYIFGFVMYIFVIIYGSMVMQGVIEEKSGKVLEVMVATVRPYQLITDDPNLTAEELRQIPLGRMEIACDNDIIWGTHTIVDHKSLEAEDLEFHFVCTKIVSRSRHTTLFTQDMFLRDGLIPQQEYTLYLEWGFAQTSLRYDQLSEKLKSYLTHYSSPHGGVSMCIDPREAIPDEKYRQHVSYRLNLLNPENREMLEEIFACLELEPNTSFERFAEKFGGLPRQEILSRMK